MSTKFEYFNTGDNDYERIFDVYWWGQSFTPATSHTITSVKLLLFKYGTPGTLTVGIRATDSNGAPTGSDLCSGTYDSTTLTTNTAGAWYEITLGAGYALVNGTKYAIVCRVAGGNSGNSVGMREKTTGGYSGGSYLYSTDSGSTWDYTDYASYDAMFEEWGDASSTSKTSSDSGSGTESSSLSTTTDKTSADSGIGVESSSLSTDTEKTSADSGSGSDLISLTGLFTAEAGSASESAAAGVAVTTGDGGSGSEVGGLMKALFASDGGSGADGRKMVSGKAGADMGLRGHRSQLGLPQKEVNL